MVCKQIKYLSGRERVISYIIVTLSSYFYLTGIGGETFVSTYRTLSYRFLECTHTVRHGAVPMVQNVRYEFKLRRYLKEFLIIQICPNVRRRQLNP
jgi:hypothetical protein